MANVIRMPDGTESVVFEENELALRQLIEEKLGFDAVKIYDAIVEERDYYEAVCNGRNESKMEEKACLLVILNLGKDIR